MTPPPEVAVAGVAAAAAAMAGFTQGLAGFGSTLVAMPLLVTVLDVRTAAPLGCLLALAINLVLGARLRRHAQRRELVLLLACSAPGAGLGAWILGAAPEAALHALLGAGVLGMALVSLAAGRPRRAPGLGWAVLAGLAAGSLGVAIGVNGPPVVAWASRQAWDRHALKATLLAYFLCAGAAIVAIQAAQGLVTPQVLQLFALALPALAAGMAAGHACSGRLDETTFRRTVLALLAASGAALLVQGLG
ncbi:MAG: sulfite exporter TauE/SafE family protein [Thermodesulfobacteriota bacterium]